MRLRMLLGATIMVLMLAVGMAPRAEAACGGCFCAAGSGTSGGYACVELQGYNRWLKIAE